MKKNAKTEDAILALLKARGAMTATDLAENLEMTAIGMRQHLKRMADQDMIQSARVTAVSHGAGRPAASWELTAESHNSFGDSHALLTKDLIESTRAIFGDEGLDQLVSYREKQTLENYQEALGDRESLSSRVEKLVELRDKEGYMALAEEDGEGGFLFIENHCPICTAAMTCQGFCRAELSVFKAVLGPDVEVERVEYLLDGGRRCSYSMRLKEEPHANEPYGNNDQLDGLGEISKSDGVSEATEIKSQNGDMRYLIVDS